jgi:hypothetical protein
VDASGTTSSLSEYNFVDNLTNGFFRWHWLDILNIGSFENSFRIEKWLGINIMRFFKKSFI